MKTSDTHDGMVVRPVLPFMTPFYRSFAEPVGWVLFRVIIGGMLMVEGWPKIIAPMAQIGFLENIGMSPGWFFSPFLAITQFIGGFMIAVGLLTRPIALINAVVLAISVWFHIAHPYGDLFLTQQGITLMSGDAATYLTPNAQKWLLADGGAKFLDLVQGKAEHNSLFWAAGAFLIAAYGGGRLSLDRTLVKREF